MRSNWAGELGAVNIYAGAQDALEARPQLAEGEAGRSLSCFLAEHRRSEEEHLALMDRLVDEAAGERSWMPARSFGWGLGYVSVALGGARGMYLTTNAVETFVEQHYGDQIAAIRQGLGAGDLAARPYAELLRALESACGDEVHHKEDACKRGGVPRESRWALFVLDQLHYALVYYGSLVGAAIAKRL